MGLASKMWWWKAQLCLCGPGSCSVLPASPEAELFSKFMALVGAWSVCSWSLSLSFPQNEQAFEEVFQNANFNTYEFRIRVKLETYNVSVAQKANNVTCGFCSSAWLHRRWLPPLMFVGRGFPCSQRTEDSKDHTNTVNLEHWRRDPCCSLSGSSRVAGFTWKQHASSGRSCWHPQLTQIAWAVSYWGRRMLESMPGVLHVLLHTKISLLQDESRIKATAMDVKPVNYREYSKRLIANIRRNAQLGWGGQCCLLEPRISRKSSVDNVTLTFPPPCVCQLGISYTQPSGLSDFCNSLEMCPER